MERLEQLVEALPVGVFILNRDGTAVYCNEAAKALLGRGIIDGDHAFTISARFATYRAGTDEPYPTEELPIVRALAGERTSVDDMEIERDGQRIALEVTATPMFDAQSRVEFAVAVFQDITARRQAQRALAALNEELEREVARRTADLAETVAVLEHASKARSLFLMNVSHELRTPLNHIIGFSDLLAERIDDARTRRLAETTGSSGRELLEKVDALIELARADAEPPEESRQELDIGAIVAEVASVFRIRCEVDGSLGMVRGSAEELRQILSDVFHAAGADAAASARREGTRLVLRIHSGTLVQRMRALARVFGEPVSGDFAQYQQQTIDLRLAVARMRARRKGGDIAVTEDATVDVTLVFSDID